MWESPPEEPVLSRGDPCSFADAWLLSPSLASKLFLVARQFERETGRVVYMISGYRTEKRQQELKDEGRPTAPPGCSTHTTCPATGADVWCGPGVTRPMKATFGRIVSDNGLRWGGGSPPDEGGIPRDWNHVDLGPRC